MKSDLIRHPCPVCSDPQRSCGHTKHDVRAHTERVLAGRRKRNVGCAPGTAWAESGRRRSTDAPTRSYHKVPDSGPGVFPLDEGHQHEAVWGGSKVLRVRMSETPAIRSVDDDGYCGQPKGAA